MKGLTVEGKVEGGLTGEIGAIIKAKILKMNVATYKRPLFEKEIAKFEKGFEASFTPSGFINALKPKREDMTINANSESEAEPAVTGDTAEHEVAAATPAAQEASKKTGIMGWLRRRFK